MLECDGRSDPAVRWPREGLCEPGVLPGTADGLGATCPDAGLLGDWWAVAIKMQHVDSRKRTVVALILKTTTTLINVLP